MRAIAIAFVLAAVWLLGAPSPSSASGPATTALSERPMTAADVEAFLDGLVPLQIEQADIAGAVVTVVRDGRVLFAKGYGFSEAARKAVEAWTFQPQTIDGIAVAYPARYTISFKLED